MMSQDEAAGISYQATVVHSAVFGNCTGGIGIFFVEYGGIEETTS